MARKSETESVSRLVFYGTVLLIGWLAYRIVQPFLVEIALGRRARDLPRSRPRARAAPPRTDPHRPVADPRGPRAPRHPGRVRGHHRGRGGWARRPLSRGPAPEPGRAGRLVPPGMGVGTSPCPVPAHGGGGHREDHGQRRHGGRVPGRAGRGAPERGGELPLRPRHHAGRPLLHAPRRRGVPGGSAPRRCPFGDEQNERLLGMAREISSRPASPRPWRSPRSRA